ncbi:four-carbon acid sugar kinase family protein [Haloarcula nitratireducens]|uniref:Four-carbon acid sugar kinase family protein n=1 Tax=Haloarcula nitratireducens TaxID=2487749 RepID=A0AAW4PKW9_9EURY|nr:four-carbon acid sugar kinase family protein [Halomicroarcula nitratireducens]MBX0298015.1 four-carbon acid sugar kinase family protein [Halomicroarcula nitratireducens]
MSVLCERLQSQYPTVGQYDGNYRIFYHLENKCGTMYEVEVVADDLTGAMDTSQGFAARGYATTVIADPDADMSSIPTDEDTAVLGINTDTRYDEEEEAIESVYEATERSRARMVYKKVDSTLRGNFAAEIDAALTASEAALALVAPAFPSAGRKTEGGVHYVKGKPVAETEYGEDGKGPSSSSIANLFGTIGRPVENISLSTVDRGSDEVAAAITDAVERANRPPILVCDAQEESHLEVIAEAAADFDTLFVGSGGLAECITVPETSDDTCSSLRSSSGAALGVAGSVSTTTLTQLASLPDDVVVSLDGAALVAGDEPTAEIEQAVRRLQADRPVVLTAATDESAVERTLAAGQEQNLTSTEIRNLVAEQLAGATTEILQEATPSGMLLTGGDIAVAVIRSLNATAITLTGEEVEAGIPIGKFADGTMAGKALITKAGGFGSEETIVNCLDALNQTDA